MRRTPQYYDGTKLTTHRVTDLLPSVLSDIHRVYQIEPHLILSAWSGIIGEQFASMSEAISFCDEVLIVKVRNSTLHSLLNRDKFRILKIMQQKFPRTKIRNIVFRMG